MSRKINKKKRNMKGTARGLERETERLTLQVFEAVDKEIRDELVRLRDEEGIIPTCHKGCYSCCRQQIATPLPEAHTVTQYIKRNFNKNELDDLKERLDYWFSWVRKELPQYLQKELDANEAFYNYGPYCPLLVNGACSVYPVRPLVCRGYYVASDPRSCLPITDESALEEEPTVLSTVPGVGTKHAMQIRAMIEMRGLNFDDAVFLLPQWLISHMARKTLSNE
jgi:Fe-S-cluster containining protein